MNLLINQYRYLESSIDINGQMIDKKLKSPLMFQYHYTSFVMSSILKKNYFKIDRVLNFYLSIPEKVYHSSNEFNVLFLELSILNDSDNYLSKYKAKILNKIKHRKDEELFKLNNNFRVLRLLGMVLEAKIKNINLSKKITSEMDWLLKLQFEDGFFPDSNMNHKTEKNRGVPHLVYHAKIISCIGLIFKYTNDKRFLSVFNKGIDVLLDISAFNYYLFYGRSTNSLFGLSCFYLSLVMAFKFNKKKKYIFFANKIKEHLIQLQHKDGHISINLNRKDKDRPAFDSYMYDIVYNAYSNAILLFADTIHDSTNFFHLKLNFSTFKNVSIYRDSGFVVYRNNNIKYCFNYKGHQNSLKHRFDSRVSPLSLLYYQHNGINLLPAVGHTPEGISSQVEKRFYLKKIYSKLYKLWNHDWLPLFSGNSFFYVRDGVKFYPFKCLRVFRFKNMLILKFQSKSRSLFSRKKIKDSFVISIGMEKCPLYKILFYRKVDFLFYSHREIKGKNNFYYTFSSNFKRLLSMSIKTSLDTSDLHRYKFINLKKLEVGISINDR
jgi:hypothetical protein